MIVLNIDVVKIPKDRIFIGKKGKYLSLVLHDNRGGPDEYGNDGFVAVSLTKEEREAGKRGEIVGNWKHVGQKPNKAAAAKRAPMPAPAEPDEIPF